MTIIFLVEKLAFFLHKVHWLIKLLFARMLDWRQDFNPKQQVELFDHTFYHYLHAYWITDIHSLC